MRTQRRRHPAPPRPPPPPHSRPAAGRPARRSRATTTACDTPAARSSTASISPGSIRNPRSFTCASARPRNSSTPSARQRARSPVRYIRARPPARHAGRPQTAPPSAPARLQIAPRQTQPRDVQLARQPPQAPAQDPHPAHRPDNSPSDGRSGHAGQPPRRTRWQIASIVVSVGPYRLVSRPSLRRREISLRNSPVKASPPSAR